MRFHEPRGSFHHMNTKSPKPLGRIVRCDTGLYAFYVVEHLVEGHPDVARVYPEARGGARGMRGPRRRNQRFGGNAAVPETFAAQSVSLHQRHASAQPCPTGGRDQAGRTAAHCDQIETTFRHGDQWPKGRSRR